MRRYERPISWEQFVALVRRHRPSDLVPAIATTAIQFDDRDAFMRDRLRLPWSLAAIAKVSLTHGNEHRDIGVTPRDIAEMCAAYAAVREPIGPQVDHGALASVFTRFANEQFRYQIAPMNEIARAQLLYVDAVDDTPDLEVYSAAVLEDRLLGCSITDFEGIGFLLGAGAKHNNGVFDMRWFDQPNFVEIEELFPREQVGAVLARHFGQTKAQVRETAAGMAGPSALAKYEFNPLVGRPFVEWGDSWLAPQPTLVFWKLFADAIYYAGAREFGQPFQNDVGRLFQTYVGYQLAQIRDAAVEPEIRFDGDQRSVDWFVIWDDLVLLIEAKATRLTQGARVGMPELEDGFERAVGRAFEQIGTTERLIAEGHPAFDGIPRDRPRMGAVVTLDSYWLANSPVLRKVLVTPEPPIPTTVMAARELERFVAYALTRRGSTLLAEISRDEELRSMNIELALTRVAGEPPQNPLLDEAWDRLPWRDADDRLDAAGS